MTTNHSLPKATRLLEIQEIQLELMQEPNVCSCCIKMAIADERARLRIPTSCRTEFVQAAKTTCALPPGAVL